MTWEFCIGNGRVWYFKLNNPQKRQPPSQRARQNFPAEITIDKIGESVATHAYTTRVQLITNKPAPHMAKLRDGRLGVNNFEEKYTRCTVTDNVLIDAFKLILMATIYMPKYLEKCLITIEFYTVSYQM